MYEILKLKLFDEINSFQNEGGYNINKKFESMRSDRNDTNQVNFSMEILVCESSQYIVMNINVLT